MKAVVTNAFGGTDQFEMVERDEPTAPDGHVVIKNAYAGLIYADTLIRSGAYARWKAELPSVLGSEVVGTIAAVGADVTDFKVGDRVSAELVRGGAYQEFSVAPAARTTPIPDEASFEAAVVYSFNMPAAYLIFNNFIEISPSEKTILMHSAAGGMGSMLTMVAKKRGHRVIALVSDAAKRDAALAFGADHVISTDEHPDYENEVLRLTDNEGVDISMNNHMAGELMRSDLKALKFRGKIILSNIINGFPSEDWDLKNLVANKAPTIVMASSATLYGTEEHRPALDYLTNWLKTEELHEPSKVYPFTAEGIGEAHSTLETGKTVGKLAIKF